jgi:maltooligosyltrehalose trehalohydrolase
VSRIRLGAWPSASGATFAAYSTTARTCEVRLYDPAGAVLDSVRLEDRGEGFFAAEVTAAGPGSLYKFALDGREFPDPWARWLPQGVHGPAAVVESHHRWGHAPVARPLRGQVIYELHVGTFTQAGTYAAARARLPYLVELGVTTIELMPVAAFAGARGWGYDGVALYAPLPAYGSPDELRAFVDEAHGLGLSVLLDVVYNHFGPAGNYLAAYSPSYFTHDVQNAWGDSPNFAHPVLRRMIVDNALYWLDDFRFDGLRLDAVHAIHDPSPKHILRQLAEEVRAHAPGKLLIGEDERNDPSVIRQHGLDAVWADDFHHAVRVTLTGEQDGYYAAYEPGVANIAQTIREGWFYRGQIYPCTGKSRGKEAAELSAQAFIYCIQNHDQVGNRAFGDRLSAVVPLEAYEAASVLLLFLPMTPLLFMGQEWAASTPFQYFTDHEPNLGHLITEGRRREFKDFHAMNGADGSQPIPDPQAPETFARSHLAWSELAQAPHNRVFAHYRALLRLRREDPVLSSAGREGLAAAGHGSVLVVRRWTDIGERILLVNFSDRAVPVSEFADPSGLTVDGRPVVFSTCGLSPDFAHLPGHAAAILG